MNDDNLEKNGQLQFIPHRGVGDKTKRGARYARNQHKVAGFVELGLFIPVGKCKNN
jgi:hypothetical protein